MFSRLYLDMTSSISLFVREKENRGDKPVPQRHSPRVREDMVKALWMEQPWGASPIRDIAGNLIEIISPGWLNGSFGPDFKDALFRLNGGPVEKGDVEIHVRSSDWMAHKHHLDPGYDKTRLHVSLYSDLGQKTRPSKHSGAALIEIELAPVCASFIDRIRAEVTSPSLAVDPAKVTGRCGGQFERLGPEKGIEVLEAAGEGRCELKSGRYATAMAHESGPEELYRGILEALGYSAFKTNFARLAGWLSLDRLKSVLDGVEWRNRSMALQGAFFGVAGLLPEPSLRREKNWDAETVEYIGKLSEAWSRASSTLPVSPGFSVQDWRLAGTRPANYPMGRLAGVADFLSIHLDSDLEALLARLTDSAGENGAQGKFEKAMGLFQSKEGGYFTTRYTFGGRRLAQPRKLIGPERVAAILINVVAPYFLAKARRNSNRQLEERVRELYHSIPPGQPNSIARFMAQRLAPAPVQARALVKTAPRQQGLIQIHTDFCSANEKGCEDCRFAKYLAKLD
ncbi:MAG: DUF2851 family protein [Nitrospinae bacterium]|nr:DUF2851 family protein [Nitrospinota bacterium]